MNATLQGKIIAILATDGVEQNELSATRSALDDAGAETRFIAPKPGLIRGWDRDHYGGNFVADAELKNARAEDYDALFIPGGILNTDKLRQLPLAVDFVHEFVNTGKAVAAICHGQQLLIEADVVNGRKATSSASLRTDLTNAGAQWVDEAVVVDRSLVTGRRTDDLAPFIAKMIEEFAIKNPHAEQPQAAATAQAPENHYASTVAL